MPSLAVPEVAPRPRRARKVALLLTAILATAGVLHISGKTNSSAIPYGLASLDPTYDDGTIDIYAFQPDPNINVPMPPIWSQMMGADEAHLIGISKPWDRSDNWTVPVRVDRPGHKVLLMLVSGDPARWVITPVNGTQIAGVIVSGKEAAYSKIEIDAGPGSDAIPTWKGYQAGQLPTQIHSLDTNGARVMDRIAREDFGLEGFTSASATSVAHERGFLVE